MMLNFLIVIFISNFLKGRKIYKSSRYEYSRSDDKNAPKSIEPANTNQLDDLLDDLRRGSKLSAHKGKINRNEINNLRFGFTD